MSTRIVLLVICLFLTSPLPYRYLSEKTFGTEKSVDPDPTGCSEHKNFNEPFSRPNWNGWSNSPSNSRFQDRIAAGLDADRVRRLKLKWAFAYPGDVMAYSQATVVAGRVFVGSVRGKLYSLNAATGCVYWTYTTNSGVRSAITIGPLNNGASFAAYFGDQSGNVYALDALTGELIWQNTVEKHPAARITGAPRLYAGRLYVPVASSEEASSRSPDYECCTFRGSIVALDAVTGKEIWKTYTIPQASRQVGKNNKGVAQWAPSGVGVWTSPTLDVNHKTLYVTTGDSYSAPAAETSDAIIAINIDTGKILWVRQLFENDAWNLACVQNDLTNCPEDAGPDYDFGSSPILVDLGNGRRALVAGQKSGIVHAVDPIAKAKSSGRFVAGAAEPSGESNGVHPPTTRTSMLRSLIFRSVKRNQIPGSEEDYSPCNSSMENNSGGQIRLHAPRIGEDAAPDSLPRSRRFQALYFPDLSTEICEPTLQLTDEFFGTTTRRANSKPSMVRRDMEARSTAPALRSLAACCS